MTFKPFGLYLNFRIRISQGLFTLLLIKGFSRSDFLKRKLIAGIKFIIELILIKTACLTLSPFLTLILGALKFQFVFKTGYLKKL